MKKEKTVTYCDMEGHKPFNWFEALRNEDLNASEWKDLERKSESWITCACGNQCRTIPRNSNGAPEDLKLRDLGGQFYRTICNKDRRDAVVILKRIEERSSYLLNQQKPFWKRIFSW